jgi:hypothetical protein
VRFDWAFFVIGREQMGVENIAMAASLISRYGNVGDADQLLSVKPTELQLRSAYANCIAEVARAFELIRSHHGIGPVEELSR